MRLYINVDDAKGIEIKELKDLAIEVANFTDQIFKIDSKNLIKLFEEGRYLDFADAFAHKNQYKEPISTSVHTYAKSLTNLANAKKFSEALKDIDDLNKLFSNMKLSFNFRLEE